MPTTMTIQTLAQISWITPRYPSVLPSFRSFRIRTISTSTHSQWHQLLVQRLLPLQPHSSRKMSSQMQAVVRLMTGQAEREPFRKKLADSNRPTWEQYKKDNHDKLNLEGVDQRKWKNTEEFGLEREGRRLRYRSQ
jgi:hypothetical protein